MTQEFSSWPSYTQQEASKVSQVLLSNCVNYWTGNECREFENEFSRWCGAKFSIALGNGTLALDAALKAIDINEGDEIIVTPRTFIASVSSVVNSRAMPIFADVDPDSGNITPKTIEAVLTPRTKAILCVHLGGWPCDMDGIMALSDKYNLYVIEDCAQAHGARYKGKSVGSIGHIGCWSFCQDKIISTGGEGGMITTNDKDLWARIWSLKDHGKNWDAVYNRKHKAGFRWLHESFGNNWRMTEMQAAIGRIQLKKMKDWTSLRTSNANSIRDSMLYFSTFKSLIRLPQLCYPESVHAYYKYYAYICPQNLARGWSRDRIIEEINRYGVPCYSGSCPEVYMEKAFDGSGLRPVERLPVARELGKTSLMFLVHPNLKIKEIDLTCNAVKSVLENASIGLC